MLAPSNPFISLDPILAVDGVQAAVHARRADVVAVSPLIGSRAVKGPLGEMLDTLGHERSPVGVARHLAPLAARFVLDESDAAARRDPRPGRRAGARARADARPGEPARLAEASFQTASPASGPTTWACEADE